MSPLIVTIGFRLPNKACTASSLIQRSFFFVQVRIVVSGCFASKSFNSVRVGSYPDHAFLPRQIVRSSDFFGMAMRSCSRIFACSVSLHRHILRNSTRLHCLAKTCKCHGRMDPIPGSWCLSPKKSKTGIRSAACQIASNSSNCGPSSKGNSSTTTRVVCLHSRQTLNTRLEQLECSMTSIPL